MHAKEAGGPAPRDTLRNPARRSRAASGWLGGFGGILGRAPVEETVETRMHFPAEPEEVWRHILFFEEVTARPPFLLRTLLPHPVRSAGDKTRAGSAIECTYSKGSLRKRMTAVHPPHRVEFEVLEQRLGIEACVRALDGRYDFRRRASGCDVTLTTHYLAYLRPRFFWRRFEKILAGQLHRHILNGMRAALPGSAAVRSFTAAERKISGGPRPGTLACTPSQSRSRR